MNAFSLLRREIREYIYDEGWDALRKIQEASIKQAHNTENNLVLAAPTASGKTEAAFLPAINQVKDWESGVKIVYVSPLIALINDQFSRIFDLCQYMDIPVTAWHGEASTTQKKNLLKDPKGILLITPESLEAMLALNPQNAQKLFGKTEWIIVDEVHSFLENNRGVQLSSLLERIKNYMDQDPRYIGMSATLNRADYDIVKDFFRSDRDTNVLLDNTKNEFVVTKSFYPENMQHESKEAFEEIYQHSLEESMLVFPNTRAMVETLSVGLTRIAKKHNTHTRYFAHHASVSKEMRLTAENFAKNARFEKFTIFCTSTLELGIDIGAVDSVVQYNAPQSVASLSQRLGRSGRKERKNILHFIATQEWPLLQGLATISLYEEGAIDRIDPIKKPYDVLAQQILSMILENFGMEKESVLTLNKTYKSWKMFSDEELESLLEYMLEFEFLEDLEGELIAGKEAERLLRSREFFAHFDSTDDFSVYNNMKKIGQVPLSVSVQVGQNIYLSAKAWQIKDIDVKGKKVHVELAVDGKAPIFHGDRADVTNEIRMRMREILLDTSPYENDGNIKKILDKISATTLKEEGLNWLVTNDASGLVTFKGTKINATLQLCLNMLNERSTYRLYEQESFIYGPNIKADIKKLLQLKYSEKDIYKYLIKNKDLAEVYLVSHKYRILLPDTLRVKYIIDNFLALDEMYEYIKSYKD